MLGNLVLYRKLSVVLLNSIRLNQVLIWVHIRFCFIKTFANRISLRMMAATTVSWRKADLPKIVNVQSRSCDERLVEVGHEENKQRPVRDPKTPFTGYLGGRRKDGDAFYATEL